MLNSEESKRKAMETRLKNQSAWFLLHDTRNYCGLTRKDYEDWLAENPIKYTKEIHSPRRYGAENEEVYNKWRQRVADTMTAGFIENMKYSKIDYWLMITGSVEIGGNRYQIKPKVVKSEGEIIHIGVTGKETRYYKKPSIYKAVCYCLSGKTVNNFIMQYNAGKFHLHVFHDKGVNMFEISRLRPSRYGKFDKTDVMTKGYSEKYCESLTMRIKKCEIDFFD